MQPACIADLLCDSLPGMQGNVLTACPASQDAAGAAEQLRQARTFVMRAERAAPGLDAWPFVAPAVASALARVPQSCPDPRGAAHAGTVVDACTGVGRDSASPSLPLQRDAAGLQRRALAQLYAHVSPANAAKLAAAVRGLPASPAEAGPAPGADGGAHACPAENGSIGEPRTVAAGTLNVPLDKGASPPRQWWVVEQGPPLGASAAWLALAARCVAGAAGDAGDVEHEYDAVARPCLNRLERSHLAALAAWLVLGGPPPLPGAPELARGALPPGLRARVARDAAAALEQALAADAGPSVSVLRAARGELVVGNGPAGGGPAGREHATGVQGPDGVYPTGAAAADSDAHGAGEGALHGLLAELRREAGWLGVLGHIQERVALAPAELAAVEAALAGRAQATSSPGARQPQVSAVAGAQGAGQGGGDSELGGPLGASMTVSSQAGGAPVRDADPGTNPARDPLAACVRGLAAGSCSAAKLLAVAAAAVGAANGGSAGSVRARANAEALVAQGIAGALSSALQALGDGSAVGAQAALDLEGVARCLASSDASSTGPGDTHAAGTPQGELSGSASSRARAPRNGLRPSGGKGSGAPAPEWRQVIAGMRDAAWAQLLAHAASQQGGAGASDAPALRLLGNLALDAGVRPPSMCALLGQCRMFTCSIAIMSMSVEKLRQVWH